MGRGGIGFERRGRAQATKANLRGGGQGLGGGVSQGGQGGGLAKIEANERLPGLAEEVGGGAHLRLDLSQSQDEQGLREVMRNRRGVGLRGDESADGEAVSPCVGLSRQSL